MDAYLGGWRWGPVEERAGSPDAVLKAVIDELAAAREVLVAAGAFGGESSHGATKSLYGADPDGNEFEIMWLLPRGDWGDYESAATVDRLDLPAELSRWSGVSTA